MSRRLFCPLSEASPVTATHDGNPSADWAPDGSVWGVAFTGWPCASAVTTNVHGVGGHAIGLQVWRWEFS